MSHPVSIAELKAHNNSANCWICLHGRVYDMTTWPQDHPGGAAAILAHAGADATEAFEAIAHSSYAVGLLDKFLVGPLSTANPQVSLPETVVPGVRLRSIADSDLKDENTSPKRGLLLFFFLAVLVLAFALLLSPPSFF